MDQEDEMSSTAKHSDASKSGHQVQINSPATTISQMEPITIGEGRSVTNLASAAVGTQQLSAGDLEALANIQEELDRMAQAPNTIVNEPDANEEEQGVVGIQEGVTGNHISKMPSIITVIIIKILYAL